MTTDSGIIFLSLLVYGAVALRFPRFPPFSGAITYVLSQTLDYLRTKFHLYWFDSFGVKAGQKDFTLAFIILVWIRMKY